MDPNENASAEAKAQAEGLPSQSPDFIEQDFPLDNIVPTRGYQMLPMVGLGGSAGGIVALQEFFKAMPADSGMVFVVIMHLSPAHESTLADLLSRSTSMKVVQATDGVKVFPNHVYVIPPGKDLATINGHLRLNPLEVERGKRVVSISSSARSRTRTGRTRRRSFSRARMAMARSASSGSRSAAG